MTDRPWIEQGIPTQARLPDHKLPPTHFVDRVTTPSNVPCGKCTLCCRVLIVPVTEEEYEQYDWAWIVDSAGVKHGRALKRRQNGECIYLSEHGCSIHGRAPHVCQRFDCRELFLKSDRKGRRKTVSTGQLPKSLFDRGREMLKLFPIKTQEK